MECWVTPDKSIAPVLQHSKFPVHIFLAHFSSFVLARCNPKIFLSINVGRHPIKMFIDAINHLK